ncbi:hypothetical protein OW763_08905 [Clostridium aestuarii]|uniref:Dipeptidyl-peptidase IV n=1 Tax=Clostridium aestuarii TaxID=338193 RepID=A0ABT4CZQ0_9CLOT|nr:hypothetical protein [Clostridium aestuarii]MCY6484456.1 hypothetical protein [Clostridium aestuarii]
MRVLKRIVIWIFISLIMQVSVLTYVDKYLFAAEDVTAIVSKKVTEKNKEEDSNVMIFVPEDVEHTALSFDGGYISYYKDDMLKVVDTNTGEERSIELEDKLKVSYYKWAPDRDIMLMAVKKEYNSSAKYVFYSYDAERNKNTKLQTKEGNETSIRTEKKSEVDDIELTPFTNMIYVKVSLKGGRSGIYSINVMKRINKVDSKAYFIDDMVILPNDDRIAYGSYARNEIYITRKNKPITIDGVNHLSLISADGEDRIYLGELEDDKVNKVAKIKSIYYGKAEQDTAEWEKIHLSEPINKKDICISTEGKIYVNDNLKGIVTEVNSKKETEYKGLFMQMYDGGIASVSNGKLVKTTLK